MYKRFENTIDKIIILCKYTIDNENGSNADVSQSCSSRKANFNEILRLQKLNTKPILAYNLDKRVSKNNSRNKNIKIEVCRTPNKPTNVSKIIAGNLSPKMETFMNQSSCIHIRNSSRKLRKTDISFESEVHNIYAPEYSSCSEGQSQSQNSSSLEISFELNDSYEELRLENCLSMDSKEGDKSIKVERFGRRQEEQRSLEPLFSVSPKKDEYIQGN